MLFGGNKLQTKGVAENRERDLGKRFADMGKKRYKDTKNQSRNSFGGGQKHPQRSPSGFVYL